MSNPFFFDYDLPEHLIAQEPLAERDAARLLVIDRATGTFRHRHVRDLPELLHPGDALVFNDTKVIPARLVGHRERTGGKWEGLFLRENDGVWEMLAQTRGYAEAGETFLVSPGDLRLTLIGRTDDRHWLMRSDHPGSAFDLLTRFGQVPLPPYIRKGTATEGDRNRYQTVYAANPGSVAAPTAGLHFTPALLQRLESAQIERHSVTLHVGLGTFASVKTDDPTHHAIHSEWCEVGDATAGALNRLKSAGKRVIAVGTTTVRSLETAGFSAFRGPSNIYVYPPYSFRVIDGMMTNFHLPRTTLLLMVQALTGPDLLRRAYEEAIRSDYRFYSYGDAMLIV